MEVEKGPVEEGASLDVQSVATGKGKRDVLWTALRRCILTGLHEGLSSVGPLWDYLCERTEKFE